MNSDLKQATKLIESGDLAGGRRLLIDLLKSKPDNDSAWVWLATVVETDDLRQECLREALKHNPRNKIARDALAKMQDHSLNLADQSTSSRTSTSSQHLTQTRSKPRRTNPAIMVFMFIFGLGMIALTFAAIREELIYRTEGQVTDATALEFFRSVYQAGGTCNLTYRFVVNGASYEGYSVFPCAEWDQLHRTKRLQVQYAAGNPHQSRYYPDRTNMGLLTGLGFVMGGFLSLYGGVQTAASIRQRNGGRRG